MQDVLKKLSLFTFCQQAWAISSRIHDRLFRTPHTCSRRIIFDGKTFSQEKQNRKQERKIKTRVPRGNIQHPPSPLWKFVEIWPTPLSSTWIFNSLLYFTWVDKKSLPNTYYLLDTISKLFWAVRVQKLLRKRWKFLLSWKTITVLLTIRFLLQKRVKTSSNH